MEGVRFSRRRRCGQEAACLLLGNTLAACRMMGFRARRSGIAVLDGLGGPSYRSICHLAKVLRCWLFAGARFILGN